MWGTGASEMPNGFPSWGTCRALGRQLLLIGRKQFFNSSCPAADPEGQTGECTSMYLAEMIYLFNLPKSAKTAFETRYKVYYCIKS